MIAVNPVVGAINTGLNNFLSSMSGTSSILLGAVLGGMMSIDMGGPFNKAAYVFGTAQLTVANAGPEQYAIMAAVMAGGMVPPLAIALCTTFFKNRFTESERKSGVVNYIMGLSFITEGAIPFAAGDPIHILPPCIVGSAVAGALSMAFKCGLQHHTVESLLSGHHESSTILNFCSSWCSYWNDRYVIYKETIK